VVATVNGVLGPIETQDLGFTLMHEHILVASWAMRRGFPGYVDREALIRDAIREVGSARERGVRTMVDLTAINIGRDIRIIREVSEKTGMQMIAATGFYWTEEPWMDLWDAAALAEYLVRDIREGIEGTDSRAGVLKCATDRLGVTPANAKQLEATALAHRQTGVPISTHTAVSNGSGLTQQDVFEEHGVDLRRVVIGHCGDSTDISYLESILERGSTIGMDRNGIDLILPTQERVATIAELCRRGWADQMVLSHDASCFIDWFPKQLVEQAAPNWNYRHVCDAVIPALRGSGVSEEQIRAMTVDNPRRIFEQQGAY
jgi:phosphotriesterase-related protein